MPDAKQRKWIPYVGTLSVLLILLIYSQYRQKKYEVEIEPIFKVASEDVTGFTVRKGSQSVTIVKQDSVWKFARPDTGGPAKYRIDAFFNDIVKGQREASVSDDPSAYAKYGVGDDAAVSVELKSGEESLGMVLLGVSSKDRTQEFVRYAGDPRVYPARQNMIASAGTAAARWR